MAQLYSSCTAVQEIPSSIPVLLSHCDSKKKLSSISIDSVNSKSTKLSYSLRSF